MIVLAASACTASSAADVDECDRFAEVQDEYLVPDIEAPLSRVEVVDWFAGRRDAYDTWIAAARSDLEATQADDVAFVSEVETAHAQYILDEWTDDGSLLQADPDRLRPSIESLWPIDGCVAGVPGDEPGVDTWVVRLDGSDAQPAIENTA